MWDFHLHSSFSSDSKESIENMIVRAQELGFKEICFTEHHDTDFKYEEGKFQVDIDAYRKELFEVRAKPPAIKVRFGIESGYMTTTIEKTDRIMRGYDFDFIIGSVHGIKEGDLYYIGCEPEDRERVYREYLEEILEIVQAAEHFNVLGHINYPSKMEAFKDKPMEYSDHPEICDKIFKTLIQNGKGMEFNTSSMRHSLETDSTMSFLKRFKELGGEILTIGTDSHRVESLNFMYKEAMDAIKAAGFKYICTFEKMEPIFHKI